MPIDSVNKSTPSVKTASTGEPVSHKGKPTEGTTSKADADHVSISHSSGTLRNLEQQLARQPVVDVQRVAAVRQEIAAGKLEFDPARVAEKLVRFERLLKI